MPGKEIWFGADRSVSFITQFKRCKKPQQQIMQQRKKGIITHSE